MSDLTLFEIGGGQVRVTPEGRASVFDLIRVACEDSNPRTTWTRLSADYPEVVAASYNLTFPGAGQRPTPTVDAEGWIRLSMLLPGHKAAAWRAQYADLVTRYLRGDRSLAEEIHLRADVLEANDGDAGEEDLIEVGPLDEANEVFEEAAPVIMERLAERARGGSMSAARLLLAYRSAVSKNRPPKETAHMLSASSEQVDPWFERVRAWCANHPEPFTNIELLKALGISPVRANQVRLGVLLKKLPPELRVSRRRSRSALDSSYTYARANNF